MRNFLISLLTIIISLLIINNIAYCQSLKINDSISAKEFLIKKVDIKSDSISINENGFKLRLDKKAILKIAKVILFYSYGKRQIRKQKPFRIYHIDSYWIIIGNRMSKYKKGGVFYLIINDINGCVEYLIHTK